MIDSIADVPLGKLGRMVQSLIANDGVERLEIRKQIEGGFTITVKENYMPDPMKNVPCNEVGKVVQQFINNDDVKKLEVRQQPDGKFTIIPIE